MKDTPLLFTPENVRKVLAGTKTQTRRIVKPQPIFHDGRWRWSCKVVQSMVDVEPVLQEKDPTWQGFAGSVCPYGQPGDKLWVREAWRRVCPDCDEVLSDWAIEYKADGHKINWKDNERWYDHDPPLLPPWRPSIFLPKKFCRLWLELTAVRVERVQEISEEDCEAEGVEWRDNGLGVHQWTHDGESWFDYAEDCYRYLWDSINSGPGGWKQNPWVWCLSFRRIDAS